ncbi:MAG: isoprenylcysteine carboxylmethyltransferase family protein [Candidatus Micrarchaeota archaeon]
MPKKAAASKVNIAELKKKVLIRFGLAPIALGLFLFLPAGSIDYWHAWLYCAILFIPMLFVVAYFLKNDPALLERRMHMREKERAQKKFVKIGYVIFLLGFIIPGLDYRFGWSNMPSELALFSDLMVLLGYIGFFLVMKENSYASRVIEVEKGQKVISTGPYAVVRHPMYAAILPLWLFTPLALGSYWALIPFLPIIPLLVYRLQNEEKMLLKGLGGYKEYCKKIRYRLIPYVW